MIAVTVAVVTRRSVVGTAEAIAEPTDSLPRV
ncbi:unannotated protein [freshwater metagenome]|uniref:Unannotated protein n=1 Tax=freshwater metagenome TaxID=449393 RepID=A0A6J7P698_9ZZZZ